MHRTDLQHDPPAASSTERVRRQTQERLAQGFAPPADAYLVQHRQKIDWSAAPLWARPVDPEIFAGCSHEG